MPVLSLQSLFFERELFTHHPRWCRCLDVHRHFRKVSHHWSPLTFFPEVGEKTRMVGRCPNKLISICSTHDTSRGSSNAGSWVRTTKRPAGASTRRICVHRRRYNTGKAVSTDTCRPQGRFVITRSMEAEACGRDVASQWKMGTATPAAVTFAWAAATAVGLESPPQALAPCSAASMRIVPLPQ